METTVTALFPDAAAAQRARQELEHAGFGSGVVASLTKRTANLHGLLLEETADGARGVGVGAAVGGCGLAIGATMMALPPIAVFDTDWWIAAALGGVVGALGGALIGFLVGSATGHQVQEEYETAIESGCELLAVNTDRAHATQASKVLRHCGGVAVSTSVHTRHHRATA
jgi:hypothetical protein